jgi:hypothetical protein
MPFADHHDMVKAFSSDRSNYALGIGGFARASVAQ